MGQTTEVISNIGLVFSIGNIIEYRGLKESDYSPINFGTANALLSDESTNAEIAQYLKTQTNETKFVIWESRSIIILSEELQENKQKILLMLEKNKLY